MKGEMKMKKGKFFRGTMATMAAVMSLGCVSAFAGDNYTEISNSTRFINEGGYVGTAILNESNTTVITNEGRGTHVNKVGNEDTIANIEGIIGTLVKGGGNTTVITNRGGDSATYVDNNDVILNLRGIIDTYADVSQNYTDVFNK